MKEDRFEPVEIPEHWQDYDILMELLLIIKYGATTSLKYPFADDCCICYDTLKDQYQISLPCSRDCNFHRTCLLMWIMSELDKKDEMGLMNQIPKCPKCYKPVEFKN